MRGSKLVAKPHVAEQRKLTRTQVLLLQSLWTPVEFPHHNNNHAPWPQACRASHVLCGQHASLQLPSDQILPLLVALQQRLQIDPNNLKLAINEILASHADPKYTAWKLVVFRSFQKLNLRVFGKGLLTKQTTRKRLRFQCLYTRRIRICI